MKKIVKISILVIILTICLTTTVYAASTYLASNITYKNTTVEKALNELYEKKIVTKELTVIDNYQLEFGKQFTYKSSDENILTVDETGLITVKKKGNASISILFDNKEIIKYNIKAYIDIITIKSAKCNSINRGINSTDKEQLKKIKNYLTDKIVTKQGDYGALLLSTGYPYVYFTLSENVNISFTSNSYSDSAGSSGKTANFYKIDEDNNENLYYTLKQENNKKNYGEKYFEKGNYVVKTTERYVEFDEWTITPKKD